MIDLISVINSCKICPVNVINNTHWTELLKHFWIESRNCFNQYRSRIDTHADAFRLDHSTHFQTVRKTTIFTQSVNWTLPSFSRLLRVFHGFTRKKFGSKFDECFLQSLQLIVNIIITNVHLNTWVNRNNLHRSINQKINERHTLATTVCPNVVDWYSCLEISA